MPDRSAVFITLEGGEGSGKSTVSRELAERLGKDGRAVTLTEEPTGTALGRHIWRFFQDAASPPVDPLAELLLFEAARAQHVAEVIRPALDRGDIVVCDRFGDSSIAYQGHGRGLGAELVARLNELATGGLKPDITLLLDIPVEIGLERARAAHLTGKASDAIGAETIAFHQRVREEFLALAKAEPKRIVTIDASRALSGVIDAAWRAVYHLSPPS